MALTLKVLVLTVAAFVAANLAIYLFTVAFAHNDDDPTRIVQPTPMKGGAIEVQEQAARDVNINTASAAAQETEVAH